MIHRILYENIIEKLFKGKLIIILGARQIGKSTLLKYLEKQISAKSLFLDGDDPQTRALLQNQSTNNLLRLVGDHKMVIIDEAQRVENIGLTLKQIFDNNKECQLIISGSSSFELANNINEPLTGRKWEYQLFPLSFSELQKHTNWITETSLLETRLLFGNYPDVINNPGNEREILQNLSTSYLYKDVFSFQDIRKPQLIEKLIQLLALQVSSEVSYYELSRELKVSTNTIEKYIDLLEKTFVVFRLPAFSRNIRNEIKKGRKIYFYDNGIRNAVISNFSPLNLRNDIGQLWENYLVSERLKRNSYLKNYAKAYFWRTTQQQEIDYIEEKDGLLKVFEFKWNLKKKPNLSKTFSKAYPNTIYKVINKENYTDFLSNE